MKQWWLEITLKSDLCSASGGGISGLVDNEVTEENGIPVIPARRIKGNLLEVGKELQENGLYVERQMLDYLFGERGSEKSGALQVQDAHLYFIPKTVLKSMNEEGDYIKDYEAFQTKLQMSEWNNTRKNSVSILELFTKLRTRTALDEKTGTAKKGSLRTMRVIRSGMKFRCLLEIKEESAILKDEDFEEKIEKTLGYCVKALRHIGLGVTRGFGEVSCRLLTVDEKERSEWILESYKKEIKKHVQTLQKELEKYDEEDIVVMDFDIHLLQPILLAGKKGLYEDCENLITGSSIQGAMAGIFIRKRLGKNGIPHEDKDFRRIFLRDGVKFGFGFLKHKKGYYYPCPSSIVQLKEEDKCFNRLYETGAPEEKRRKSVNKMIFLEENANKIFLASPKKEMRMHHARPVDRGIGHALRDRLGEDKMEEMGQFFQYVALTMGQTFCCEWQGSKKDIKILLDCLKDVDFTLNLGRSKSAEYGKTLFIPTVLRKIPVSGTKKEQISRSLRKSKKWIISLLTPMIVRNLENGRIEADPRHFITLLEKQLGNEHIELLDEKEYLKFTHVGGYNSKWRLPYEQKTALDAGTVFVISTESEAFFCQYKQLEYILWGEMAGMGYGKIKIEPYVYQEKQEYYKIEKGETISLYSELKRICDENEKSEAITLKYSRYTDFKQLKLETVRRKQNVAEKIIQTLEENVQIQQDKKIGFEQENKKRINSTLIEQLISMFYQQINENDLLEDNDENDQYIYEKMIAQVKNMNDGKKKEAEDFLKPCVGKSIAFVESYLKKEKWSVRNGYKEK